MNSLTTKTFYCATFFLFLTFLISPIYSSSLVIDVYIEYCMCIMKLYTISNQLNIPRQAHLLFVLRRTLVWNVVDHNAAVVYMCEL